MVPTKGFQARQREGKKVGKRPIFTNKNGKAGPLRQKTESVWKKIEDDEKATRMEEMGETINQEW